jgi:NIMA-interacting peptidyl-prolyl cis-trans isomerase 1
MIGSPQVAPPPPPWVVQYSKSQAGAFYFYNSQTGVSQWERPDPRQQLSTSSSSSVRATASSGTVTASHILIKHRDSRNPYSWREKDRKITKTKEEATRQLQSIQSQLISSGGDAHVFARMAEKMSDCTSARVGGTLGAFEYGKMQPSFSAATFALRVIVIIDLLHFFYFFLIFVGWGNE